MPNNFRITGGRYVSKDGSDANAGTDPNLPKATPAYYAASETLVIGSCVYKGAFALNTNGRNIYKGDGITLFNLTANLTTANFGIGQGAEFHDLYFLLNAFTFLSQNYAGITELFRCVLDGGTITTNAGAQPNMTTVFDGSIMKDATLTVAGLTTNKYLYSQIFNSSISSPATDVFDSSYVDAATTVTMPAYFSTPATQFVNCNFQGKIVLGGTTYELKKDKSGSAIDPNPSFSDLALIDATVYDRGNFSQDPEHNNLSKRDYFSVAATSPNLFADSTSLGSIGNVLKATTIKATDTQFDSGATVVDLTLSAGDYTFSGAGTFGTVTSAPIQLFPIPQQIKRIDLAELLTFNSSEALGSAENSNVVISDNYTTGTAGANPRRLTFEMRWSTAENEPTTAGDWDNNAYITAGDYAKFEHFMQPMIDPSGKGNGEPDYTPVGAVPILAKWAQFRITIYDGIG